MNKTESKYFLSLDGTWKFNWVANADQRPTDFYKEDLDDSKWKTMNVPGNWEMNGFGDPEYVNNGLHGAAISTSSHQLFLPRTTM